MHEAFVEHKGVLIAYLSKYLLRPEDIEDILQDTFVKTLEVSQKRKILSPRSYLFIVARNLIFRQLKQKSKYMMREISEIDERHLASADVAADINLHHKMKMDAFVSSAQALPAQCRRVFLMRKLQGMSHKEISKKLGISTSTVERHITNAIKQCQLSMGDEGYTFERNRLNTIHKPKFGKTK